MKNGAFMVLGGRNLSGLYRLVDPISHADQEIPLDLLRDQIGGKALLVARKLGGAGVASFDLRHSLVPADDLALSPTARRMC